MKKLLGLTEAILHLRPRDAEIYALAQKEKETRRPGILLETPDQIPERRTEWFRIPVRIL
jgi:hypothetical protein